MRTCVRRIEREEPAAAREPRSPRPRVGACSQQLDRRPDPRSLLPSKTTTTTRPAAQRSSHARVHWHRGKQTLVAKEIMNGVLVVVVVVSVTFGHAPLAPPLAHLMKQSLRTWPTDRQWLSIAIHVGENRENAETEHGRPGALGLPPAWVDLIKVKFRNPCYK